MLAIRQKILLASVLKPLDDTRMLEKFGQTLAQCYEVHIMGFESQIDANEFPDITFHPISPFERTKTERLSASLQFWKICKHTRPQLIIIHAVELLPIAMLFAKTHGAKLIYDIRENYWYNILHQPIYKPPFKYLLAFAVRVIEYISRLGTDRFFLAERCYAKELPFLGNKFSILENKCVLPQMSSLAQSEEKNNTCHLVYSGTISSIYGAKEAFLFAQKLYKAGCPIQLTMIGKFAEEELGKWLQAQNTSWFCLIGNSNPIPHRQIMEILQTANFALLPYKPNASTANCIPTKMYECLAMTIPMVVQQNPLWEEVCLPHSAGIFIDFSDVTILGTWEKMHKMTFYPNGIVNEALWESEQSKLLKSVSTVLGN